MPTKTHSRLTAQPRTQEHRKSELRALRRSGMVPASLYGHGDTQSIQVSEKTLQEYLRRHSPGAILDLEIEGAASPALIREVERDPITGRVIHVGLQRVDLRENIRSTVTLVFTGDEALISDGLVPQHQITELEVHGEADLIPESITVDLAGHEAGHTVRIADLQLPAGVHATKDGNLPVATITAPSVPADVAAALDLEAAAHADRQIAAEEEEEATAGAR
jgi:large subunit ribosomal protein L25